MSPALRASTWAARLGAAALVAGALAAGASASAGAAAKTLVLSSRNDPGFSGILADASGAIYVLSTERGGKLHCTGKCLSTFRPLLVATSTTSVKVTTSVKGKIGFVKRPGDKQVTFNGYPLYTDVHDTTAATTKGESLAADGGRWYLVHAAATTNRRTPVAADLQSADVPHFSGILESSSSDTLYVLSAEQGGSLHCTSGTCLSNWVPMLVPDATTAAAVSRGAGVDGTIGFVSRGLAQKQVTFNSFPVYRFAGDTGPNETSGQGISADGGTWTVVDAAATTAAATQVS